MDSIDAGLMQGPRAYLHSTSGFPIALVAASTPHGRLHRHAMRESPSPPPCCLPRIARGQRGALCGAWKLWRG